MASETRAFLDRGHEVITLGIEENVTICCDVRQYYPSIDESYDFMWFSPPCTEFSIVNNPNLGSWKDRKPDMSIVDACFRIIETCKPKYWVIENPAHGLRHFISNPATTIKYSDFGYHSRKLTDLWGVFPMSFLKYKTPNYNLINLKRAKECLKSTTGIDRTKMRSVIPYNLSLAMCKAIEDAYNDHEPNNRDPYEGDKTLERYREWRREEYPDEN